MSFQRCALLHSKKYLTCPSLVFKGRTLNPVTPISKHNLLYAVPSLESGMVFLEEHAAALTFKGYSLGSKGMQIPSWAKANGFKIETSDEIMQCSFEKVCKSFESTHFLKLNQHQTQEHSHLPMTTIREKKRDLTIKHWQLGFLIILCVSLNGSL